jgi:hypothetical protein
MHDASLLGQTTVAFSGTLEEKVFQRQLSKEGLSNVVNQSGKSAASHMSTEDLADLFTPDFASLSSTYESMAEATEKGGSGDDIEEVEGTGEMSGVEGQRVVHRKQVRCSPSHMTVCNGCR